MGLMGRYIDTLPAEARDRLIQAQDWCVATVRGADGARCLVGHAEDWEEMVVDDTGWRSWMDIPALTAPDAPAPASDLDLLCRPELFAFRRARPADLQVYRARLLRWGSASEGRIGARFDRLCTRHGMEGAVRIVKRRAGRAFAIDVARRAPAATVPAPRGRAARQDAGASPAPRLA